VHRTTFVNARIFDGIQSDYLDETQPLTYVASYAAKMLSRALDCGFTTVRDVGGGGGSRPAAQVRCGSLSSAEFHRASRCAGWN
jgi:hypothetical protein